MRPKFNWSKLALAALAVLLMFYFYGSLKSSHVKQLSLHETPLVGDWRKIYSQWSYNTKDRLDPQASVREQLAFQFPYDPNSLFESHIWQTWKVGPEHKDFPQNYARYQATWDSNNPEYSHHILSDGDCDELVSYVYSAVPSVVEAYHSMPKSILKADFFRYLILLARGGVYSDMDTISLKPINSWASLEKGTKYGLVVGIEADPDRPDWAEWFARRIQFCQWTIQAKTGHPMLAEIVARITEHTLERKRNNQLTKVLTKDEGGDVMIWTGPAIWTDTIFEYLQSFDRNDGKLIDWSFFTGMEKPIAVEDVLVLPITSFSPGVGHMGSKSNRDPMAYVEHEFLGVWKTDQKKPT